MPSGSKQQQGRMASQDAMDLLTQDHRKVEKMFDEFKKSKDNKLVKEACNELKIHTQIEEEIFYPALRKALDETDLLDEAKVEHDSAKELISQLEGMRPNEKLYAAKFTVLGEYIKHHVKEEEKELFPKAKKTDLDFDDLGEQLRTRKQELQKEMGIKSED